MSKLKDTELNKIQFDWVGTPEEFFCFEDGWKKCAARILEKARKHEFEVVPGMPEHGKAVRVDRLEKIIEELTK